jgi:hypothetical protein
MNSNQLNPVFQGNALHWDLSSRVTLVRVYDLRSHERIEPLFRSVIYSAVVALAVGALAPTIGRWLRGFPAVQHVVVENPGLRIRVGVITTQHQNGSPIVLEFVAVYGELFHKHVISFHSAAAECSCHMFIPYRC